MAGKIARLGDGGTPSTFSAAEWNLIQSMTNLAHKKFGKPTARNTPKLNLNNFTKNLIARANAPTQQQLYEQGEAAVQAAMKELGIVNMYEHQLELNGPDSYKIKRQ